MCATGAKCGIAPGAHTSCAWRHLSVPGVGERGMVGERSPLIRRREHTRQGPLACMGLDWLPSGCLAAWLSTYPSVHLLPGEHRTPTSRRRATTLAWRGAAAKVGWHQRFSDKAAAMFR